MKFYLTILLCAIVFFNSCNKDEKIVEPIIESCVKAEELPDSISGFYIFGKGKQEFGFAKGIKINEKYESSVFVYEREVSPQGLVIVLVGYWEQFNSHLPVGEAIYFGPFLFNEPNCYYLTDNRNTRDSINSSYDIGDDDVGILNYRLDTLYDNQLEILSIDRDAKKIKARLKASFIAKRAYLPDLPMRVRFSDVYIEHGY